MLEIEFDNKRELISAVDQSVRHWLNARYSQKRDSLAVAMHRTLTRVARKAMRESRSKELLVLRRAVLAAISQRLEEVFTKSLAYQASLRANQCRFSFGDNDFHHDVSLDAYPSTAHMPKTMRLSLRLRELSTTDQRTVLKLYNLSWEKQCCLAQLGIQEQEASEVRILQHEIERLTTDIQSIWTSLNPKLREWFNRHVHEYFPVDVHSAHAIPWINDDFDESDFLDTADLYERSGNCLRQPSEFAKDASSEQLESWKMDYAALADTSDALSVVAAWLRGLAGTFDSRKCGICFRHLSSKMKKYCSCHSAEPGKRIPKRTQLTARVYKQYKSSNQSFYQRSQRLRRVQPAKISTAQQLDYFRSLGVSTTGLRHDFQHMLEILLHSYLPIRNSLNEAFVTELDQGLAQFVRYCMQPFDSSTPEGCEDTEVKFRQDAAVKFMTLSGFVSCWFGKEVKPLLFSHYFEGKTFNSTPVYGHDPCHPSLMSSDLSVKIRQPRVLSHGMCGVDLLHHDAWLFCEEHVRSSYSAAEEVQAFKAHDSESPAKKPSLRKAARELGMSHENLRQLILKSKRLALDSQSTIFERKRTSTTVEAKARSIIWS